MAIEIPVAHDVDSPNFRLTIGNAKYVPEDNKMIWNIKHFPGGKEFVMLASYSKIIILFSKFLIFLIN